MSTLDRMPAYHSSQVAQMSLGNIGLLALRGDQKGPGPRADPNSEDVIDEAIRYFKANVFFKSFKPENDSDRLLIYVTLWIQECLKTLQKCTSKDQAWKELYARSVQEHPMPGDSRFPLNAFIHQPSPNEASKLREYLKQVRLETSKRMIDHALKEDGKPDKWWMCFAKKRFLGLSLSGPGY